MNKHVKTPGGKYITNPKDILEVVGPYEIETTVCQSVSKFGLTIRCINSEYMFGYDTLQAAQNDAIFIDSI